MKKNISVLFFILIVSGSISFAQEEQDKVSYWETLKIKFEEMKSDNLEKSQKAKDWIVEDIKKIGDWEYKLIQIDSSTMESIETKLNELGMDRWECYWIDKNDERLTFYLKRPKISYLQKIPSGDLIKIIDSIN